MTTSWKPEVDPADILVGATVDDVVALVSDLRGADVWSLDVETRGTESWLPTTCVVGMGFAWSTGGQVGAKYLDRQSMAPDVWARLLRELGPLSRTCRGDVVNHNFMFDAAMLAMEWQRISGEFDARWFRYSACTYGLYKQLAGEGWFGQRWGLKDAQIDLLGWESKGSDELDEWLVANGWHKRGPGRLGSKLHGTKPPAEHLAEVQAWLAAPTRSGKRRSPGVLKSEMWRAPAEILGKYCILDAISTLQLFADVLRPALQRFPELERFHRGPWVDLLYLLVEQQRVGIRVDRDRLAAHAEKLRREMLRLGVALRTLDVPGTRVAEIERARFQVALDAQLEKEPKKFKERKLRAPKQKFTKRGDVSAAWKKYEQKLAEPPVVTKSWLNWEQKVQALRDSELTTQRFSFTSAEDLRELLYAEQGGLVEWEPGERPDAKRKRRGTFWIHGKNGRVEVELTKGGALAVGADAMAQLPDTWGEPLRGLRDAFKELTYVETYLSVLHQDEAGNWRIHPGWRAPGPVTGRLAGAEPNFQQIPKSVELLACFLPDEGKAWDEYDFAAIEPHVLAELSRDAGLLQLYGPEAKPHDRYLFSVAQYPGAVGDAVRRLYPRDDDPQFKQKIKEAKRELGEYERKIGKKMVLSGDYGAGWRKQFRGLMVDGVKVTPEQVQEMNEAHRQFHCGVYLEFGPALEDEWHRRGGYVLNGLGFPICIDRDKLKDCINRCLAGDTLVRVKDAGWKRLDNCTAHDVVWDGVEWVSCSGLLDQGTRDVINSIGITGTADHKVLTQHGWKELAEVSTSEVEAVASPGATWCDVWELLRYVARQVANAGRIYARRCLLPAWTRQSSASESP